MPFDRRANDRLRQFGARLPGADLPPSPRRSRTGRGNRGQAPGGRC